MSFTGVILIGGKSSRMGEDKAQLQRLEQSMLSFTQQQLELAGAEKVVISSRFGASSGIADEYKELGPLAGIYSVLLNSDLNSWCLFCPVDLPFLSSHALIELVEQGLTTQMTSHYQKQPIPIFAQATKINLEILKGLLESANNLSIRHFLNQVNATTLPQKPEHNWFNANTPEEWQQAINKLNSLTI